MSETFRDHQPVAWTFHRHTSRWLHNTRTPPEEPPAEAMNKELLDRPLISLPAGQLPGKALGEVLVERLSCRRFTGEAVGLVPLASLLVAAYGVTGRARLGDLEVLERPVPSGGGLYPLEVYVLVRRVEDLEPGIFHYSPLHHGLEWVRSADISDAYLSHLFMGQHWVKGAGALLVFTAVTERSLWKYGDRGYRYLLLEAGHAAQNVNLAALGTDGGLGTFNLGGFYDHELANLLAIDVDEEIPLYAVAVGVAAAGDRSSLRNPPEP